ncbi:G-protein coupled receptor 143-like [Mercenaria mercenaria]|uniref:G-protein coupled receptor 143-like n=1 Tax=Mercenaria mercenaria TaxID=6596 RepID=UPI00234EBED5|nr:G-protein coupled receptor 143-like [Mercenaria mercenaria]XP_053376256.1 G-protein coupled receptor 143-like [Mercenaria mercenaria]
MASASFVSSCCLGNQSIIINSDIPPNHALLEETVVSIISLIVSIASFLGTFALVLPWRSRQVTTSSRQTNFAQGTGVNHVTKCLITAGSLANIGLIVRSSVWLGKYYPPPDDSTYQDGKHIFCIISTLWVQYFFLSVIFWHLVYGLETFMTSNSKRSSLCLQYFLGWVVPAALCALAAVLAYQPSLDKCGAKLEVNRAVIYVIFLLPIVFVLLLIIILFYKSYNNVKRSLIRHFGRFSTLERQTMDNVSIKFIIITTAFIVCWIPNIMNGIFVNVLDDRSGQLVLVFIVLESVLNPFQVLIDSMVMFGWPPIGCCCLIFRSHSHDSSNYANINDLQRSQRSRSSRAKETDPLLSFSRNQHTL